MLKIRRREFLHRTSRAVAGAWFASTPLAQSLLAIPALSQKFSAADTVSLGRTGIQTSRLAMGTGTVGSGHHSHQTALGIKGLSDLLLDRFRRELGTDYIDIFLMHCLTDDNWTTRYRPVMDVLSEARQKGIIRTHGCSCHTLGALRAAAKSSWVEVDLVRINPIGSHMDADPETVVAVLRAMRAAGKGIIGMKILGQGDLRHRQDEALRYALGLGLLDAFTIGAESISEQDDLIRRISAA